MSTESRHIDHLFDKARKAKVDMSTEDVVKVIAKTTLIGSITTVLLGKFKIMNIFLISAAVISTTVVVVNNNINPVEEETSNSSQTIITDQEGPNESNNHNEPIVPAETESNDEIKFVSDDPELSELERNQTLDEEEEQIEVEEAMQVEENSDQLESEFPAYSPQDYKNYDYFNVIMSGVSADIVLKKGSDCGVNLITTEFEDVLEIKVKDKSLVINVKKDKQKEYNKLCKKNHPKLEITMKDIKGIYVSGSGNLSSEDDIPSKELEIYLSGSGDIELSKISPESWKVNLSGSGDVSLNASGNSGNGEVNIAGSGDVEIPNLSTKDITINIAGSGDVQVKATGKLHASIAGSGDVCYSGEAKVTRSVRGSGDVRKDCK